jgi:hypothetical protein
MDGNVPCFNLCSDEKQDWHLDFKWIHFSLYRYWKFIIWLIIANYCFFYFSRIGDYVLNWSNTSFPCFMLFVYLPCIKRKPVYSKHKKQVSRRFCIDRFRWFIHSFKNSTEINISMRVNIFNTWFTYLRNSFNHDHIKKKSLKGCVIMSITHSR